MTQPLGDGLDANQTQILTFDPAQSARRVVSVNSLIPIQYDSVGITYITSGDGTGEIGTITYHYQGDLVALLNLNYDDQNRLISVTRA